MLFILARHHQMVLDEYTHATAYAGREVSAVRELNSKLVDSKDDPRSTFIEKNHNLFLSFSKTKIYRSHFRVFTTTHSLMRGAALASAFLSGHTDASLLWGDFF